MKPTISQAEDGGSVFLRSTGTHLRATQCHYLEKYHQHFHRRKNLKSHFSHFSLVWWQ
jgi:hypothetical protein